MNSSNWRERMVSDLVVAGMADRTREAYVRAVRLLSRFYNDSDPLKRSPKTRSKTTCSGCGINEALHRGLLRF